MNEEDNLSEEGLEDPYESALKKAKEAEKKRIEAQKDDLTEGKIKRKRTGEEDVEEGGGFLDPESGFRTTLAIGTEVGLNTILDLFSMDPTQISQVLGAQAINYLAQRIRGGEFSEGEMIASGLASLIPGAAQAKSLAGGIARTATRGAVSGALETGAADLIDTGEIDSERVAQGAVIGGAFGGIFGTAASQPATKRFVKRFQNRLNGEQYAKFTPEEIREMGLGQPMMMAPQRAAIGAAPDPFKQGTPIKQQFGPYPQVPVNAEVKKAVDIDAAKDDIISNFSGKKTIRTPQGKGQLIYELDDGANVMFEVDLRGDNGIFRRDQLIAVPATQVALDSRKVLESIPEDLEYWISNKYGPEYLEQYKTWVKGGRDRLVDVRQEMQEAILSMRAKEIQREVRYSYPPGDPRAEQALARFNTPQNQRLIKLDEAKLEDSHILSIGTKGKLTRVGLTEGVDRALKGSTVAGKKTPNVTQNFPKGSRVYDPPAAYQSFIEYWRLNRARGAGIALENVPEEEAIQQLQELGLPTSWLEDFINFALLDIGIRKELTNKDVVKLLKQGFSAEAVIEQRLRKLAREKANLDITDFAYKMQDLSPEEAVKAIDKRYQREILAGTRPGDAFKE